VRTWAFVSLPWVPAAEGALREALGNARGRGLGVHHKDAIGEVMITSDNRWLITGSKDETGGHGTCQKAGPKPPTFVSAGIM
jgi:hypothetical protein